MKKLDMKIVAALVVAVLAVSMFAISPVMAAKPQDPEEPGTFKGNGFPSGQHFTLNILGKADHIEITDLSDPEDNPIEKADNGHRIFVRLSGKTRIMLEEAIDFNSIRVIDADGTDGRAVFALPDPGAVCDPWPGGEVNGDDAYDGSEAAYLIFLRVLGPPRGDAEMRTGVYTDEFGGDWIVSQEVIYLGKTGGNKDVGRPSSKAVDVTKELTTIVYDFDSDGRPERIQIFDEHYEDYFWDYDNNGLKHVQMRLYPTPDGYIPS